MPPKKDAGLKERRVRMQKKTRNRIIIIAIYGILGMILLTQWTYNHELVHYRIYTNYGCDANIEFVYPGVGLTTANCTEPMTEGKYISMIELNVWNEIVSYNLAITLMFTLLMLVFFR